jgi:hypothetical protein
MTDKLFLASALLVFSTVAFAQQDGFFQIGYAANLNAGDSVVNISNDGDVAAFFGATPPTAGNLCVNVYTFDPAEEEISCCSCLVTPNALVSLSVKNDLITNTLTSAIPNSVVIKLFSSEPATSGTTAAPVVNVCNPSGTGTILGEVPPAPSPFLLPVGGMLAWGTTLEPTATLGTYGAVHVPYINATVPPAFPEYTSLTTVCGFLQTQGSGYGICSGCGIGALSGAKN